MRQRERFLTLQHKPREAWGQMVADWREHLGFANQQNSYNAWPLYVKYRLALSITLDLLLIKYCYFSNRLANETGAKCRQGWEGYTERNYYKRHISGRGGGNYWLNQVKQEEVATKWCKVRERRREVTYLSPRMKKKKKRTHGKYMALTCRPNQKLTVASLLIWHQT